MNELGGPAEIDRPSINSSGPIKKKKKFEVVRANIVFIYLFKGK